jgi:zinc protease
LRTPLFPQEAVTRESTLQLEALKTRSDHPSAVVSLLFTEGIFKGHPYGIDAMGTEATLKSLTSSKVFNHWGKMVSAANSVFSVVGDFEEGKILKRIEEMTKVLSPGKKYDQRFPVPPLKSQKYFSKSQKEQTHIIVGYRGLSLTDPDNYAADVLQSILAGQGGRLFINLRDKASLAYSVSPINLKGIETGYFGIYIGCSAEKGKKAIEMIKQELEHICNEVPSHDEVERAKRYLAGRNHIDLQRNGSQASSILFDEIYGIDCEETFRYAEHLKDITGRQVNELAKRLFEAPEVIAAVGQSEPW